MKDKYRIDIIIDDEGEEELLFFINDELSDLNEILGHPDAKLIITTLIFDAYSLGQDNEEINRTLFMQELDGVLKESIGRVR